MSTLGYVLLEWRTGSVYPELASDEVYSNRADAIEDARTCRAEAAQAGRRERYSVGEVVDDFRMDEEDPS